jgi:hypothetical protein
LNTESIEATFTVESMDRVLPILQFDSQTL